MQGKIDPSGGVDPAALRTVGELNSPTNEWDPTPSADGLTLYFYTEREGAPSGGRIFVTRRASLTATWDAPVPLGDIPQPAEGWVAPGYLSTDNCRLYYYVCADGVTADLWMARRR
jgi:hypothetical protein